jgi:hypothetical protein
MEAARLTDEGSVHRLGEPSESGAPTTTGAAPLIEATTAPLAPLVSEHFIDQHSSEALAATSATPTRTAEAEAPVESVPSPLPSGNVRIDEVALCSGSGEVLYDWECRPLENRLQLLDEVEQHAAQISHLLTAGRFDRLEIITDDGRIVCHLQPDRRLFVRSTYLPDESVAQ